jgi:septal ring factor EnvC (AmiA/AmiB activator)
LYCCACSCDNDALQSELKDLRELMASEATTRATLQDQLDESERQLGELRNDLDMTKSVSNMKQ